jgi:hypothetical protein
MKRTMEFNTDFTCTHCRNFVSAGILLAGVNNRNHCPYCLWSRHMDLFEAGDRLSACKATMQPIGLTMKKVTKKYASAYGGELMLVHLCIECGALSINRIAADDDAHRILEVLEFSNGLRKEVAASLKDSGIRLLSYENLEAVTRQLFGEYQQAVMAVAA